MPGNKNPVPLCPVAWLLKNSLKCQLSPDWRLLGKFDYARSESSLGQDFDSDYTEAVVGYAYRPVEHPCCKRQL